MLMKPTKNIVLLNIYNKLYAHFGPRHWWPADSPFEVMIGAILTQNAAWSNVEKAISNLKHAGLLTPKKIEKVSTRTLQKAVRPSGFYKEKAKKLKDLVRFLSATCSGNIKKLSSQKIHLLRNALLGVNGIGPETADSILLYALRKRVFVVDAYTKRIFTRHGLLPESSSYDEVQDLFIRNLPSSIKLFNEYHALIVETGKNYCKKRNPKCKICPLKTFKYSKNML